MTPKNKLIEHVLASCESEYKEKISLYNQLDSKSQQIAGFSGLLLGFIISILDKYKFSYTNSIGHWGVYLFSFLIFLLICVIIICIYSMKIYNTIDMPTYNITKREYQNLILKDESILSIDKINNFLNTKITLWEKSLKSVDSINKLKARIIYISQILIGICLFGLGFMTITLVLFN